MSFYFSSLILFFHPLSLSLFSSLLFFFFPFFPLPVSSSSLLLQVCVLIGTARALAAFITLARSPVSSPSASVGSGAGQSWTDVLFHTVSFVGSEVLATELIRANSSTENIVVTQVVPPPRSIRQLRSDATRLNDPSLLSEESLLYQFASDMDKFNPESPVTFGAFEGYLAGQTKNKQQANLNRHTRQSDDMRQRRGGEEEEERNNKRGCTDIWTLCSLPT